MFKNDLAAVAAEAAAGVPKPQATQEKPPAQQPAEKPAEQPAQQPEQPAQQPSAAQPSEPPVSQPAGAAASLDAARAEGRAAERAYRNEVEDLCALAGQPGRARAFVEAGTEVAEVRRQLLAGRADADGGRQISTQHTGAAGAGSQKGALAGRMTHLVGKREG